MLIFTKNSNSNADFHKIRQQKVRNETGKTLKLPAFDNLGQSRELGELNFFKSKMEGSFHFCDSCEARCRKQENTMFVEQKWNDTSILLLSKLNSPSSRD